MDHIWLYQDVHPEAADQPSDHARSFAERSQKKIVDHGAEDDGWSTEAAHLPHEGGGR